MNPETKAKLATFARFILALLILAVALVPGVLVGLEMGEPMSDAFGIAAIVTLCLLLLLIVLNQVLAAWYKKKIALTDVRAAQDVFLANKERVSADLDRAIRKIVFVRRAITVYSAVLFLLTVFLTFCIGVGVFSAGFSIFPFYLLYGFLCRVHPGRFKPDWSQYCAPSDYPTLHAIAKKAAAQLGMQGEIRILLLPNCNAGIAKFGKTYSLQLGVVLLDALTEEELYQVLLHEFAHMTKDGNPSDSEFRFYTEICEREDGFLSKLFNLLFVFPDCYFVFEYTMYRIASSVALETNADRAVLTYGDPQTAVNALAKLAYYDYFDRELSDHIPDLFYEPEEVRTDSVEMIVTAFRGAVAKRADFWRELMMHEIQPRNASHPIFRARMEALGVKQFDVTLATGDSPYRGECHRALEQVNQEVTEARKTTYAEDRKAYYLRPLKTVEQWEQNGKKLTVEEIRPVMDALRMLCRDGELDALCDDVIENNDNKFATAHAHMTKGMRLLQRYDKRGIEHIYQAIEINHNYIDEGMQEIGMFSCMMGLQDELERYRERAVELGQLQVDKYEQTGDLTAKDNLCADTMPEEMRESILSYIREINTGVIQRVYLVRKVITDDFFASVFVVQISDGSDEADVDAVMDKLFNHLDTRPEDWQFSLFYYNKQTAAAIAKVKNCCVYDASEA